ncbi:unnamed protein product [marine sediment metagenome]|uniref:Uncharacterized protein n=1 Tax=marine sediment metagenome TaxID=412755 RepID=X1KR15_9ZZZZ
MANEKKGDINRLVWPKDGDALAWVDRAQTILDILTRAGTMLLGYRAFERVVEGSGLSGAIVSQIAMKLAQSNNLASGAAGVATLAGMGVLNVIPEGTMQAVDNPTWIERLGLVDPLRPINPLTGEPMP